MKKKSLDMTEEEWLNELKEASMDDANRIDPRRKLSKEQLEYIELAKNNNYSWKTIVSAFNKKFDKSECVKSISSIWNTWKDRKETW